MGDIGAITVQLVVGGGFMAFSLPVVVLLYLNARRVFNTPSLPEYALRFLAALAAVGPILMGGVLLDLLLPFSPGVSMGAMGVTLAAVLALPLLPAGFVLLGFGLLFLVSSRLAYRMARALDEQLSPEERRGLGTLLGGVSVLRRRPGARRWLLETEDARLVGLMARDDCHDLRVVFGWLALHAPRRATRVLEAALDSGKEWSLLEAIGPEDLVGLLQHDDPGFRRVAVATLGEVKPSKRSMETP